MRTAPAGFIVCKLCGAHCSRLLFGWWLLQLVLLLFVDMLLVLMLLIYVLVHCSWLPRIDLATSFACLIMAKSISRAAWTRRYSNVES